MRSSLRKLEAVLYANADIPYAKTRFFIDALVAHITKELQAGRTVTIRGLGKFGLRHVEWYVTHGKVRNGPVKVRVHPAADYPKFTPAGLLKRNVWKVRKPDYGKGKVK